MKSRTWMWMVYLSLVMPVGMRAQDNSSKDHKSKHKQYKLIDLETFGGPASLIAPSFGGGPENPGRALTNRGVIVGAAQTPIPDPNCNGCFVFHAFRWQDSVLTDLGTLQGVDSDLSSGANWINDRGWIAGFSYIGGLDPLTASPASHAVLWRNGEILDLGTLGEDFGAANALNNSGQVVGFSLNTIPDPVSILGLPTEVRAFLWQNGVMQDLGTLGGLDAIASAVNESGQIAGFSSTNQTPNATTGAPTVRPFLWDNGKMIDLGTLGGTLSAVDGPAVVLNNRGQVGGTSTLAGDMTYHPFLWEQGVMKDLGTLGGDTGFVTWITDAGDVIGTADLPGPSGSQSHHAFLWRNGVKTDLGALGGTSHAEGVNSQSQIVGRSLPISTSVQHAFIWENGGPMVDLNSLIPANSSLLLEEGGNINDRGEIAGRGLPAGCNDVDACGHAFLLIPNGDCDDDCEARIAASQNAAVSAPNSATIGHETRVIPLERFRNQVRQRYRIPGNTDSPRD